MIPESTFPDRRSQQSAMPVAGQGILMFASVAVPFYCPTATFAAAFLHGLGNKRPFF
jgi:hypothetical protein